MRRAAATVAMLIVLSTSSAAKRVSHTRLEPMIAATPSLGRPASAS